ncbi:PREDICTED: uncharacterized protein LOC104823961 isoform X2 [Tarenaya hassleriana]|uniref:uncharacterized protein LOC104823961 isoform X2 n=1 Tax=Tarenaya hassleriana TaxID=28532 RepID=UPI00053C2FE3|nr:PREDICTED: uncharacterized protein LOC104823961 isoform X2 [Tarenaya hassleriana]
MTGSTESNRGVPNLFSYYRSQAAALFSEDDTPFHDPQAKEQLSADTIGAEMSHLRREKLNALLKQCVKDLNQEADEMLEPVRSLYLLQSQLRNKTAPSSLISEDVTSGEDIELLLASDSKLLEETVSNYSSELLAKLDSMEQELEKLLDNVMTACRPMTRAEKRDLQKSIKELPAGNLDRVAEITQNHYLASGKDFSNEVLVDLEQGDNIMLWRLHFYVQAVKSAQRLAAHKGDTTNNR